MSALLARQRALGDFLRTRRERLAPASVGLPQRSRRRTPGLRREEVAQLADIGTTWYTWLEQGREVHPSQEVLEALARALLLDGAERRHLFALAGYELPAVVSRSVEEPLLRMLESLEHHPAYILDATWNLLAWNEAASVVFGDYGKLRANERNIIFLIFANEAHRQLLADWEAVASVSLNVFRADSARFADDPELIDLIGRISERSPEFCALWERHDVAKSISGAKRINHPLAGRMAFEHTSLSLDDDTGRKLVVYTPLSEQGTIGKLKQLLNGEQESAR